MRWRRNAVRAENLPMPEYTVHPGDIMIKFTGSKDRIIRVTDRLSDKFTDQVTDQVTDAKYKELSSPNGQMAKRMTQWKKGFRTNYSPKGQLHCL